MRPLVAAAVTASVMLIAHFGAPVVPVALGAALTCAYYWWRGHGRRRAL